MHYLSPPLYKAKRNPVKALTRKQIDHRLLRIHDRRDIVVWYGYYKDCYNSTTMLYGLLFIQGKANWLCSKFLILFITCTCFGPLQVHHQGE